MTGYEYARRKRSYERNLGWCRIWLGIGIAIASLSFTFVFERNIQPLLEPRPAVVERPDGKSPIADAVKNQPVVPTNRSNVAYGFLSAALISYLWCLHRYCSVFSEDCISRTIWNSKNLKRT